jgi:choline kinase
MKAIILAAGRGSRMGERTRDLPKCMATLAGRTLLEWQVSALRAGGIDDITVVRGYRAETIQGDFSSLDNPRWAETNMVRTLECAKDLLRSGPCLMSYSDIAYHPDHVRALSACPGDIAITYDKLWHELWSMRFEDPLSDAETFLQEDGVLKTIGGKTHDLSDIQGQYMGLVLFRPAGWNLAEQKLSSLGPAADKLDMTSLLRALLTDGAEIRTVPVAGKWCEADNQDDLAQYEKRIEKTFSDNTSWSHDWRWTR